MKPAAGALLLAWAIASPAAAEAPKAAPAEAPERAAKDRPSLNLKLDNPSSWATVAPEPEKERGERLPGLGADARPHPQTPPPAVPTSNSPFPKDTTPGVQ